MDFRDYLCKAKSCNTDTWELGYLIFVDGKAYITKILRDGYFSYVSVKPETVCRYTGKVDYEANMIFEHDVFAVPDEDSDNCEEFRYEVTYDKEDLMWYASGVNEIIALGEFREKDFDMRGNTIDNPELMEVSNEEG